MNPELMRLTKSFSYFTWKISIFFSLFLFFVTALKWAGIRWEKVMLHTSAHHASFSSMWMKIWWQLGGSLATLSNSDNNTPTISRLTMLDEIFLNILIKKTKTSFNLIQSSLNNWCWFHRNIFAFLKPDFSV